MKIPRALAWTAAIWTGVFWVSCIAVPVTAVLLRTHSLGALVDPSVCAAAAVTVRQALWSTAFSVLIGLPLGLLAARASGRFAVWIDTILLVPSGVPTVVAATSWVIWLGRSGWLAKLGLRLDLAYSLPAVIVAHVFFNAPWIAIIVAQSRRAVPEKQMEAARSLGASAAQSFSYTVWPQLKWTVAAACAQIFAFCSMSFSLVLILGGGPPVETLETEIYSRIRYGSLDLSGAAACAVWELLITLTPWFLVLAFQAREKEQASVHVHAAGRKHAVLAWVGLVFLLPYIAVFVSGSSNPWFHGEFWQEIATPLRLSLELALGTAVGACLTAALAIVSVSSLPRGARSWVSALLSLPSGISVLVLGLGGWLAYQRFIDPFSGSRVAMVGLQIVVFFPLAFRMLWPTARSLQRSSLEAAVTLGATPWRAFWWVEWPRWRGPVASALALVAGGALGELAAVSFFYSEDLIPLPLLISRWMAQYRFEEARAVAALLLVTAVGVTVAVSLISRVSLRTKGTANVPT